MSKHIEDSSRADLAYATSYAGAIGSAVIATLFLLLDTIAGRPLATAVLMGSALFTDDLIVGGSPLRLDLAAAYSLVHLGLFSLAGGVFAVVAQVLRGLQAMPFLVATGLFATLTLGVAFLDAVVAPDLLSALGIGAVLAGNAAAAAAMTSFLVRVFAPAAAWVAIPTTLIGDSD